MTAKIERLFSTGAGIGTDELSALPTDRLDVSAPRCVWDLNGLRADSSDDQAATKQWRRGLFAFYGATTLLLCGIALIGSRPAINVGAAAPGNWTIASTDPE
jgi:hypothetical protein